MISVVVEGLSTRVIIVINGTICEVNSSVSHRTMHVLPKHAQLDPVEELSASNHLVFPRWVSGMMDQTEHVTEHLATIEIEDRLQQVLPACVATEI